MKVLLDLFGGVALLLWGLHMVHSGIVRAFGARIRSWMGRLLKTRLHAFGAGLAVTALLQSSTATALMLSSFAASGLVALVPALGVMLGANVGTALIVQALSFDASAISPMLLLIGVIAFKRSQSSVGKDIGRVAIGLGLMLLSLHILLDSLEPAEHAPVVRELFAAITGDTLLTVLIGALLAWAAHSSVATILLIMSFSYSHFVTPHAALALVLGANVGSAITPFMESLSSSNPAHRRLPMGNLLNRVLGCVIFMPLLGVLLKLLDQMEYNPVRLVVDFHTLFNVVMALAFMPVLPAFSRLLERWLPDMQAQADPAQPLYLDAGVTSNPAVALACASRETLHMGDIVHGMLQQSMKAMMENDRKLVTEVCKRDNVVDSLHEAIKLYVVKITQDSLDETDSRRAMEILSLAINLEHIGDIIDKSLMELAAKKIKRQLDFSDEGAAELEAFHNIIQDNLKLALNVFLTGDVKSAHHLLAEKKRVRHLEMVAAENHLMRLRQGRVVSIESSSLHLDILRDLKRIHSHICATAYPALEAAGQLPKPTDRFAAAADADSAGPNSGRA